MNTREVLGITLEFGFHEIKKYIQSGFADKLSANFDIVWLAIDKGNPQFDSYFRSTGFPLIYFKATDFRKSDSKTEARNQSIRRNWMVNKDLGAFHNYKKVGGRSLRGRIIGSGLLKKIYESRTLQLTKDLYKSNQLEGIFKEYRIDHLLGTGYASTFTKSAFVTADKLGIKTWYLVNSWKDLYIDNFLPFDFLTGIFVWSEQMRCDYLYHMPYLERKRIHISGNPSFDVLKGSFPAFPRSHYAKKYGISEQADWILYTMMPPVLINDEIETVKLVANELVKHYNTHEKVIIVRKNPNHSKEEFANLVLPFNTVIAEHFCAYDKDNDMIVQSPEGELEWIDLLHHCILNLSVPSTVTLEFLALNKSVINIGFGPTGTPDSRLRQHFEAGYYKRLFDNKTVMRATNLNDLNAMLARISYGNSLMDERQKQMYPTEYASNKIIEHIIAS